MGVIMINSPIGTGAKQTSLHKLSQVLGVKDKGIFRGQRVEIKNLCKLSAFDYVILHNNYMTGKCNMDRRSFIKATAATAAAGAIMPNLARAATSRLRVSNWPPAQHHMNSHALKN